MHCTSIRSPSCDENEGLEDLSPQELPGWDGYIEWERYPERKERAARILKEHKHEFAGVSRA